MEKIESTQVDQGRSRTSRLWPVAMLAVVIVGSAGVVWAMRGAASDASSQPVVRPARSAITAMGWLDPASSIVKIAAPATVEASRLAELHVQEGDAISLGQVIGVLDTAEKIRAQLKTAEAQVALKRALVERAKVDVANSIVARQMAIARAKADVSQAESEFDRQRSLVAKEFATPANLEKKKRDLEVAKAQIAEAEAALRRLDAKSAASGQTAVQIDIAVAERELAAAEADLTQTRILLEQASIRSPIAGRVLTVMTRPGERISQDGVVEIGSTERMVAVVEVYQSDISLIQVGQRAEIRSDAFAYVVTGAVERIGLKVKRQSVINNDPATDTDARVIEVRIALDPASSAKVAGLSRLQVRARFAVDAARPSAAASVELR